MSYIFSNIWLGFYYYITFFVSFIDTILMIVGSGLVLGLVYGLYLNFQTKR